MKHRETLSSGVSIWTGKSRGRILISRSCVSLSAVVEISSFGGKKSGERQIFQNLSPRSFSSLLAWRRQWREGGKGGIKEKEAGNLSLVPFFSPLFSFGTEGGGRGLGLTCRLERRFHSHAEWRRGRGRGKLRVQSKVAANGQKNWRGAKKRRKRGEIF